MPVRKDVRRFKEIWYRDAIFLISLAVALLAFVISPVLGAIAAYLMSVMAALVAWNDNAIPFRWVDNGFVHFLMVVLAPITCIFMSIVLLGGVIYFPFYILRATLRDGETVSKKGWAIGIVCYYLVLAAMALVILVELGEI